MKRLALPVVLSVVFAMTGSPLFAGCFGNSCRQTAQPSDFDCNESFDDAAPVYGNTEFPGTCGECKDKFAYSLWADYCQTKRRGPAYRLPRHKSCLQCGPTLGECASDCAAESGTTDAGDSVTSGGNQRVQPYPTGENDHDHAAPIESQPVATELDLRQRPHAPLPPESTYYGAPRSNSSIDSEPGVPAEFDEATMPSDAALDAPAREETEDTIKRSVDDAIERALESSGRQAPEPSDILLDRSAKNRPSLFRIFRPRSR